MTEPFSSTRISSPTMKTTPHLQAVLPVGETIHSVKTVAPCSTIEGRFREMKCKDELHDPGVNLDVLEQHEYEDAPGHVFYTCPKCGGEYLASFLVRERGETMCSDCWAAQSHRL